MSEIHHWVVKGRVFDALAPLLDGTRTEEDVVTALEGACRPAEVWFALDALRDAGLIGGAPDQGPLISALRGRAPRARNKAPLRGGEVTITCVGDAESAPLRAALGRLGVGARESAHPAAWVRDADASLDIVLASDAQDSVIAAANARALCDRRPWLFVKTSGHLLWVGPLFVPGETACWRCLLSRVEGRQRILRFLERHGAQRVRGPEAPSRDVHRALADRVAAHVAALLDRNARLSDHPLFGAVETFDRATFERGRHRIVRRPQCPACGDPRWMSRQQSAPVTLRPETKGAFSGTGQRAEPPERTAARLDRHVSPVTGIVGGIVDALAISPKACSLVTDAGSLAVRAFAPTLEECMRPIGGGKGWGEAEARASALGEAIERYSSSFHGDEPRIVARYCDLLDRAVHPRSLLLYSASQLASAKRSRIAQEWVPEPFDETAQIAWSEVFPLATDADLTERAVEGRYFPTALLYLGYAEQHGTTFGRADSNGCAAGRTREEAILQGFCELVERDSVALWWYNRAPRPEVDVASLRASWWRDIQRFHRSLGRDTWVLDLTTDLGVPAFAAVSVRRDGPEDVVVGFGAHVDPKIAALRALTEVNQLLPAVLDRTGAPLAGTRDPRWANISTASEPFLRPSPTIARRTLRDFADRSRYIAVSDDISAQVRNTVARAREVGLDAYVLDCSRPDTDLCTVRVIVPGLRHFWPRFAPGRLYDVPVRLGWIAAPVPEENLNKNPVYW